MHRNLRRIVSCKTHMLKVAKTHVIDARYCGYDQLSAVYLLVAKNGDAALVDTGTPAAFEGILEKLKSHGVKDHQFKAILLTHAHLDHSGNLSLFTRHFPHIKVFCSEATANQMIDPSNLCKRMSSSLGHRWAAEFRNEVHPVAARFFETVSENDEIKLGDRVLRAIMTPGHIADHISIVDEAAEAVYTGDAFGMRYTVVNPKKSIFATSPFFEPEKVYCTLDKIASLKNVKRAGVAHFGFVENIADHAAQCRRFTEKVMEIASNSKDIPGDMRKLYDSVFGAGCTEKWHRLAGSLSVNYAGVNIYLKCKKEEDWRGSNNLSSFFKVPKSSTSPLPH